MRVANVILLKFPGAKMGRVEFYIYHCDLSASCITAANSIRGSD